MVAVAVVGLLEGCILDTTYVDVAGAGDSESVGASAGTTAETGSGGVDGMDSVGDGTDSGTDDVGTDGADSGGTDDGAGTDGTDGAGADDGGGTDNGGDSDGGDSDGGDSDTGEMALPCVPPFTGLHLWHRYDELIAGYYPDHAPSSSAGHGLDEGTTPSAGWVGDGAQFSGSAVVRVGTSSILNPTVNSFSVSMWVRVDPDEDDAVLVNKATLDLGVPDPALLDRGWILSWSAGLLSFHMSDGPSTVVATADGLFLDPGAWRFVVVVVDRPLGEIRFAVDDQWSAPQPFAAGIDVGTSAPLRIGGFAETGAWGLEGELDELQLWAKVTPEAEVSAQFFAGASGLCFSCPEEGDPDYMWASQDPEACILDLAPAIDCPQDQGWTGFENICGCGCHKTGFGGE